MKMINFKKIIPLSLAAALLLSTTVVYAEGTTPTTTTKRSAYSQDIKDTRSTILTNHTENKTIRKDIAQAWINIKDSVKSLKGTGTLKAKKTELEAKKQEIKSERTELKTANDALKSKMGEIKQDKINKDFAKLSSDLKGVPAMQQSKTGILQKISSSVSSLLELLKGK